ncbi:MAG: DNA translocase FtsK [Planctomycetota bacterium]
MSDERKIGNDIIAVVLLAFIVFLIASLASYDHADPIASFSPILNSIYQPDVLVYPSNDTFQNACGGLGAWTADLLLHVLGIGAFYFVVGLIALEVKLFQQRPVHAPWFKTVGWLISLCSVTSIGALLLPDYMVGPVVGSGGYMGALLSKLLIDTVGSLGSILVALSLMLIGVMMWTEYMVFRAGRVMFAPAAVAAASLLPFGILHGIMLRLNRKAKGAGADLVEDEDADLEEDEEELHEFIQRRRRPTTIKIRGQEEQEVEEEELDEEVEEEPDEAVAEESVEEEVAEDLAEEEPEEEEEFVAEQITIKKPAISVTKKKKPAAPAPSEREEVMSQLDQAAMAESIDDYELPSIDLLVQGDNVPFEDQKRDALKKARILENTCQEFGYKVNVVEVETGPVISQYEIQLEAGLRLQKITALADDLAIALRVPSVRIVAPIPGKNTVGVEVPNENRQVVRLREVMEQCEGKTKRMNIPLFLGNDAVGAPMVVDLAKMPHLLIAGRTGTGKSVCLNAIISSILMTRRPDEVRMLMIDPKMVELSGYGRLPHLMHPVVTDMRKAEAILAWAVEKMEDRYRLLAKAGVRHINSYNQLGEEELIDRLQPETEEERRDIPGNLPFIVIVADEMADLMMTAGKEVEQHIIRLAQKSRAVGIHLILATQKPTVDVITGLIKSNLPARLAFQVASKMDSRVVLDSMGAEKLLGCGDMLFLWPGTSTLLRGQGTFLSDDEIELITDSVSTGEQNFVHELVNIKVEKEGEGSAENDTFKKRDELYSQAVDVVVNEQRGSVSLLQRTLGIGYGRAARLIDFMEEDGYVGPYNGSKSREVILTPDRWAALQSGESESEEESVEEVVESVPITRIEKHRQSNIAASSLVDFEEEMEEVIVDHDEEDDAEEDEYLDGEVEDYEGDEDEYEEYEEEPYEEDEEYEEEE